MKSKLLSEKKIVRKFKSEMEVYITQYQENCDWQHNVKKAQKVLESINWLLCNLPLRKEDLQTEQYKVLRGEKTEVEAFLIKKSENIKSIKRFDRGKML